MHTLHLDKKQRQKYKVIGHYRVKLTFTLGPAPAGVVWAGQEAAAGRDPVLGVGVGGVHPVLTVAAWWGGSLCVVLTVVRGVTLCCPHCITSLSRLGWVQPPLAGGGWMLGCWTLASSQLASPRPGCNMAPVSSPLYTSQSTSPLPMSQAFHPHCRSLRHQQDRGEERILGYKKYLEL